MAWADKPLRVGEDDRLSSLPIALDEERMKGILASRAKECLGATFEIEQIDMEIYRRHANRCVVQYRMRGRRGEGFAEQEWSVIGKVLAPGVGEAVFHKMQQLWAHGFAHGAEDAIGIPEPLEFMPALSMLLQEVIGGTSVRNLAKQSREEAHFRIVARALAKLHRCPMPAGRTRTVEDLLVRCHPKYPVFSLACPELAPAIEAIVERARAAERRLAPFTPTPVHGDFHLGQVHVGDGRAWLVDFDTLGFGDPASDLGNVTVFLKDKSRHDPTMRAMMEAFLDEYFAHMEPAIGTRMPLYEALTHLRRACKQFRLQEVGWREKVEVMIERGLASMDEMEANLARAAHTNGRSA
jgi:hypothetical protein